MANQKSAKKNNNADGRPKGLAFSRSFNISEGKFWQADWNDRAKQRFELTVYDKAVLASKSYDMDESRIETDALQPNPQSGQACALASNHDTLRLDFSAKIFPVVSQLHSCPSMEYRNRLVDLMNYFKEKDGFFELAQRYVNNIANARFLWRNRRGARQIETVVRMGDETFVFNSRDFILDEFVYDNDDINKIARAIADAFAGQKEFLDFTVTCFANLGEGMEVFPSQEMTMGNNNDKSNNAGKVLFSYEGSAGMHSQKIGNAIRTIDTWYPDYETYQFPIPVETYGANRSVGIVFRKRKDSFYGLIDKYITDLEKAPPKDLSYIMAVIIRGGLFGTANDSEKGE